MLRYVLWYINLTCNCVFFFIDSWQDIIDKCLLNRTAPIRESATLAFSQLCRSYYKSAERESINKEIVTFYLKGAANDTDEHVRMGYISALGVLPIFMIIPHIDNIVESLIGHCLTPYRAIIEGEIVKEDHVQNTTNWSEARRDSVKALSKLVTTVGFDKAASGIYVLLNF